jgi:hypothetical protein
VGPETAARAACLLHVHERDVERGRSHGRTWRDAGRSGRAARRPGMGGCERRRREAVLPLPGMQRQCMCDMRCMSGIRTDPDVRSTEATYRRPILRVGARLPRSAPPDLPGPGLRRNRPRTLPEEKAGRERSRILPFGYEQIPRQARRHVRRPFRPDPPRDPRAPGNRRGLGERARRAVRDEPARSRSTSRCWSARA